MNTFVKSINNQMTTTTNGMPAYKSTGNDVLELFSKIGAARRMDITPLFTQAYIENRELALRVALYARDIQQGLGEKKVFIEILQYLETVNLDDAKILASKSVELGRFKDLLFFKTEEMKKFAADIFFDAIQNKENALAAKWLPSEKGANKDVAKYFARTWGKTPKQYRKFKSSLNNVVESKLCAQQYDEINFEHVPSIASVRLKNTFFRRAEERYKAFLASVEKGEKKINVVNATPNQVLKQFFGYGRPSLDVIQATKVQWDALPDLTQGRNILPIVDTSASMRKSIGGTTTTAMEMSISLGLYLADKNKGAFNGAFVSFATVPVISLLKGTIYEKFQQVSVNLTYGSTNIEKTFNDILKMAVDNKVTAEDMPEYLLILSDMQFDSACNNADDTAIKMIDKQYEAAGYTRPKIIFWNLVGDYKNSPVRFDTNNTAFVSGYTQNLLNAVLTDLEEFSPENIMMKAIMKDRYTV